MTARAKLLPRIAATLHAVHLEARSQALRGVAACLEPCDRQTQQEETEGHEDRSGSMYGALMNNLFCMAQKQLFDVKAARKLKPLFAKDPVSKPGTGMGLVLLNSTSPGDTEEHSRNGLLREPPPLCVPDIGSFDRLTSCEEHLNNLFDNEDEDQEGHCELLEDHDDFIGS